MTVQVRPSTAAGLSQRQAGALVRDSLARDAMVTLPTTVTPLGVQPGLRAPAGGTKARYMPTTSVWSPLFFATTVTAPVSERPGRRRTLAGGLRWKVPASWTPLGLGVAVGVGVRDGVAVGVPVEVAGGVAAGVGVAVAVTVAVCVGVAVGDAVAVRV